MDAQAPRADARPLRADAREGGRAVREGGRQVHEVGGLMKLLQSFAKRLLQSDDFLAQGNGREVHEVGATHRPPQLQTVQHFGSIARDACRQYSTWPSPKWVPGEGTTKHNLFRRGPFRARVRTQD